MDHGELFERLDNEDLLDLRISHFIPSPTYLYNGMVHPVVPAAIKGAIWYQGEANGNEGMEYTHKMEALISGWRSVFDQGDFPFYFVQLANFQNSDPNRAEGGDGWSRIRQAQLGALRINNTGMAVAIDVGEANDIHPRNKQDVGHRLAQWALAKTYDMDEVVPSGPIYKEMKLDDHKAVIHFDHVGSGLMAASKAGHAEPVDSKQRTLNHFSIC